MENVLTVKRDYIEGFIPHVGISTENIDSVVDVIVSHHEFVPRTTAENDPTRKQIIPYVVLCRGDEVFATRRLNKGGEQRLHGLISLGIGGHINLETDGDGDDVLYRGLKREVKEEVDITFKSAFVPRGLINDDSNDVGKVHLGMFFTLDVEGDVSVRETDKLEGFWVDRSELESMMPDMETWSRLVVSAFFS